MKKSILLMIIAGIVTSFSFRKDNLTFKAYSYAIRFYDVKNNSWPSWSEWTPTNMVIVIYPDNHEIKVFSKSTTTYHLVSVVDSDISEERKDTLYKCVDSDGLECQFRTLYLKEGSQFYIFYDNVELAYSVEWV